jgi:methyl-accepting chemotaxis protein
MIIKRLFSTLSLRVKLLTIVALLSFGLIGTISYQGLYPALSNWRFSEGLGVANRMSDRILHAASREALERGITNTLISQYRNSQQINPDLVKAMGQQREEGDGALVEAIALGRDLEAMQWANGAFHNQLEAVQERHQAVKQLRAAVDAWLAGQGQPVESRSWVEGMTTLIHTGARLRDVAFPHQTAKEIAVHINEDVKGAVWGASEYAGLERAIMGQHVAAKKALSAETYLVLAGHRSKVDAYLAEIRSLVEKIPEFTGSNRAGAEEIQRALNSMDEVFLNRFQRIREQVYAEKESGDYPLTPSEWLAYSTEGIESILAVNAAISGYVDDLLEVESQETANRMLFNLASILISLLLAAGASLVVFGIVRRIDGFVRDIGVAQQERDLTRRLNDESQDELGRIAHTFNLFWDSMASLIHRAMESSIEVASAAFSMGEVAERTRAGIALQQGATEEVTGAVDQMVEKITMVAANSQEASTAAAEAKQKALDGVGVTEETIAAINTLAADIRRAAEEMQQFEQRSQEIGGIVAVIRAIAEQTNLLSLNAAIEAARAGESGRGFAVVADEVRNLAQRTQTSTEQIHNIIQGLQDASEDAIEIMRHSNLKAEETVQHADRTSQALGAINQAVDVIARLNGQIALTTQEQAEVSNGISVNLLTNISQFSHLAEQSANQTQASSMCLGGAISELQRQMGQYKVSDDSHIKLYAAKASLYSWKVRIKGFLDGLDVLTHDEAVSPQACDFGKWLYSEDTLPYREIPEMQQIHASHDELHQLVREALEFKGGSKEAKEQIIGRIDRLAQQLVSLLEAVEERVGAKHEAKFKVASCQNMEQEVDDVLF